MQLLSNLDAGLDFVRCDDVQLGRGHVRVRRRHGDGLLGQGEALRLPEGLQGLSQGSMRHVPFPILILNSQIR